MSEITCIRRSTLLWKFSFLFEHTTETGLRFSRLVTFYLGPGLSGTDTNGLFDGLEKTDNNRIFSVAISVEHTITDKQSVTFRAV